MVKAQDIVVMMKLVGRGSGWTFEEVAKELGLSSSAVHRSVERAQGAGLYDRRRKKVIAPALLEFIVHGAKYVFPATWLGEARGMPTAWAAPPLSHRLSGSRANPPVWPHPRGEVRGIALEPLHPVVPDAARRDKGFAELLALFDAIRIGNARERSLAIEGLEKHLGTRAQ
jgi:hypothetical protein